MCKKYKSPNVTNVVILFPRMKMTAPAAINNYEVVENVGEYIINCFVVIKIYYNDSTVSNQNVELFFVL